LARNFGYEAVTARMRMPYSHEPPFWFIRTMYAILGATRRLLQAPNIDVVHAESSFFQNVLPACIAKCLRRRIRFVAPVFHLLPPPHRRQGYFARNALAWLEQRLMVGLLALFADLVVIDNPTLVDSLVRWGVDRRRLFLTQMGVRSEFSTLPPMPARQFDAIFCGRLSAAKGVEMLLDAWRIVVDSIPSARLALVGAEQPQFDVRGAIAARRLEQHVVHLENLHDNDMQHAYLSSKIFVTASTEEGYGLSLLEAFACGLPAVTFDLPAFAYAFPYGRVVAKEPTARALADAIIALLADASLYESKLNEVRSLHVVRTWPQVAGDLLERIGAMDPRKMSGNPIFV
jgi:glycosyltransferase involved in cell wall biosynthesis